MTGTKKTASCPACGTEWHIDMRLVKERTLICPNCQRVDFIEYFVDRDRTLKAEGKTPKAELTPKSAPKKEESNPPEVELIRSRPRRSRKGDSCSLTSDCFIVTATYGTESYQKLTVFYKFRDEFLLRHPFGVVFTRVYYQISPYPAQLIRRSEPLRRISRFFLDLLASLIQKKM
ncbi:MAG: hypothetical protein JW778_06240 [Candidatus Altiarchaeota archaeon]|nr:hypothetical protein [Candidatus Altiarchaeota archaeon]